MFEMGKVFQIRIGFEYGKQMKNDDERMQKIGGKTLVKWY